MANPIRISPQKDFRGEDNCPQCLSHVNYNQAIHKFNNKVISRVQTLPQAHVLPKGALNYAILRLHQEAVWMKLALYENTPPRRTSKGHIIHSTPAINILIDTGAALSLIKEDIIANWKITHPENISLQDTSQEAETCSGSLLQITNKCIFYNCNLSGGPLYP